MTTDAELQEQGWEQRSVLCEPRLSECVELYEQLGFEVRLLPLDPHNMPEGCGACYTREIDRYRVVYVRRKD
jgi:hypothetical protein